MKAGIMAPLYLSISWILTVSYQLLTETAVNSVAGQVALLWPSASNWITNNLSTIVFVYAFTWIFVLSSVIPSKILGKERGVLTQYIVVLTLSLIAFFMPDILFSITGIQVSQILTTVGYLENPLIAGVYLAVPYLFMLGLDLHARRAARIKRERQLIDDVNELNQITLSDNYSETETDTETEDD